MNDIILGDCLEKLSELPDNLVDLIVTDPPYFLPANHAIGSRKKKYKRTLSDTSVLKGYFKQVFEQFIRVVKEDGTMYIFCDGQSYPVFYELLFPHCKSVKPLIWDKIVSFNGYTWRHQHELILWAQFDGTPYLPTGDGDILKCRGVLQKDRLHPSQKPVELMEKLIAKHPDSKVVLDPYAGSGSTLQACKNLDKEYIGIELDEGYYDIMENRLK